MWGTESWGTMLWGGPSSVPLLGPLGLLALVGAFVAGGLVLGSRKRTRWLASIGGVGLAFGALAALAAVSLPYTFTNGQIADADQVNANFDTITGSFGKWSLELDGSVAGGNSAPIPDSVLVQLCADEDGCSVRLVLADYDMPNGSLAPIPEALLVYQPATGFLRIDGTIAIDGNGVVQPLLSAFDQCYLTDGEYVSGSSSDGPGLNLLKWINYPGFSRCRLTLID